MAHEIRADLADLDGLARALEELRWYTGRGGYRVAAVSTEQAHAVWALEPRPVEEQGPVGAARALPAEGRRAASATRRTAEPGDQVIVETKAQQMARRAGHTGLDGVEGTVFRVLTRGPHPRGMKVELRDGTIGRIQKNVSAPGAGEPASGS